MKIKYLILVSLILAIITIGAVSASENADDVAAMEDTEDAIATSVENEDLSSDGADIDDTIGEGKEIDMKVTDVPKTVKYGEAIPCNVSINNEDATGTVYVYVDSDDDEDMGEYDIGDEFDGDCEYSSGVYTFGNHTLFVKYSGDENYASKILNFTFKVEDFDLTIDDTYGDAALGSDYKLYIDIPYGANGQVIVTYKGVQYTAYPNYDHYVYVTIPSKELEYGLNNVTIHYIPDEYSEFSEKTVNASFNCTTKIYGPIDDIEYGDLEEIVLNLPANAAGNLTIKINGNESKNITVVNGKASFPLNDLVCGEYSIEASYTGKDYNVSDETFEFEIIPKVDVPTYVYSGDANYTIVIALPESTNGTLVIKNDEELLYSNESAHGVIPIVIASKYTDFDLTYTSGEYTFENNYEVEINDNNPKFEINITDVGKKVIITNTFSISIEVPETIYDELEGNFILYVDGKKVDEEEPSWGIYLSCDTTSLSIGNHTWAVEYSGDEYYTAENKSGSFEVSYIEFNIPENITVRYDEYDAIGYVYLPEDATGLITVYIDGKEFDSELVDGDIGYAYLYGVPMGKHDIEVKYEGNYPAASYKGQLNVDYILRVSVREEFAYGQPVNIDVLVPEYATGNVVLNVAGKNYTATVDEGMAVFTVNDLPQGKYTATATYLGDSSYPSKTANKTFEVKGYAIILPEIGEMYYGEDYNVTLTLPSDANGTLFVKLDGEEYKNATLINGKAIISLKDVAPGRYNLEASFEGNYTVESVSIEDFDVSIFMDYTESLGINEKGWIYIKLPANAAGNITITLDGKEINVAHVNGIVNHTLQFAQFGSHNFTLAYTGEDYDIVFGDYDEELDKYVPEIYYLSVAPTNINLPDEDKSNDNKITFNLPEDAKGKLSIYEYDEVKEEYQLVDQVNVTGPNVSVSLDMLKPGDHDIKFVYEDEKYGNFSDEKYVTISKPTPSIVISNSGDDKVAVFTFELPKNANKSLLVKIDGTSYYVAVKDGAATLTVNNLAMGNHKISATYSGDENYTQTTVNKNVTVASSIPASIAAKDLSVIYTAGTKYSVTVYAEGGVLASGVEVVIKVNGKKVATVKTNDKGVATYKIVQVPGTYKITAEALGKTITKKLTVKHVLKLQKVKVKRSAKKLVIKATLAKVNGKYLKGKKITLKFKGKKYTAKTNKKGVAKFTIKKNVLKKLKKGKKVKYQATYLKDTIKYTVKVKK